jgi:hypothetical protein
MEIGRSLRIKARESQNTREKPIAKKRRQKKIASRRAALLVNAQLSSSI